MFLLSDSCSFLDLAMARVKNAGGGLGDEDPRPLPCLPSNVKGKVMKKITSKKRKFVDTNTVRAVAVAATVEHAERGGACSGVVIADQLSPAQRATVEAVERCHGSLARTIMLEGQHVVLEESLP